MTHRPFALTRMLAAAVALCALAAGPYACTRRGPINVEKAKAEALKASGQWIKLLDAGDYTKAWNETAEGFRKEMSEREWTQGLRAYRKPMGKMIERTVAGEQYANALSDSPSSGRGDYVVIHYRTRFERKDSASETVLTMLKDGRWVVAGYFIR